MGSCAFSWSGAFFVTGSNDKSVSIFRWLHPDAFGAATANLFCNFEDDHRLSALQDKQDAILAKNMPKAHNSDINDAIFVNEKSLVTGSSDKSAKLWNLEQELKIIDQRNYAIYSMDVSLAKGLLIVSSMDGKAKIWNTQNWNLVATLSPPGTFFVDEFK